MMTKAAQVTQAAMLLSRPSISAKLYASCQHLSSVADNHSQKMLDYTASFEPLENAEIAVSRVMQRHDEAVVRTVDGGLLTIHKYLCYGKLFPDKRDAVIGYMTDNGYTRVDRKSAILLPSKPARAFLEAPKYHLEAALPEGYDRIDWSQPYVIPKEDSFEFAVHYYTPKEALENLRIARPLDSDQKTLFAEPDNDGTIVQLPSEATTDMGKRWRKAHARSFPHVRALVQAAVKLGEGPKGNTPDYVLTSSPDGITTVHELMRMWYPDIPVFVTKAFADTGMGFAQGMYFLRRDAPMTRDEANKLVNP